MVAKEYTQTYGIDYEETFAQLAKMNTVRIIISLAAHFGWAMHQFDVKNAFLHGSLEENVYMEIHLVMVLLMKGIRCADLRRPYMVLNNNIKLMHRPTKVCCQGDNNHLVFGLEGLLKLWYLWGTNKAQVTILDL